MYSTTLVFFSLLSSAFGFLVTRPSLNQGWTNQGPQTVAWDRVSTDARNFTLILTNLNRQTLATDIVLANFVDAVAASSVSVSPPSSGWPTAGGSYRVNLVKSANEPTTIYAQSSEFNITAGAATATAPSSTGKATTISTTGTTTGTGVGAANAGAAASGTGTSEGAATTDDLRAPPVNGASVNVPLSAGLFAGVVTMLGAMLL